MISDRLQVGSIARMTVSIPEEMVTAFIELSGDTAPLHADHEFARAHGFNGRLVHGALIVALLSRFVGTQFPGPQSLWLQCDIGFRNPCYAPTTIRFEGTVTQCSVAMSTVALAIVITDDRDRQIATAKTIHKIFGGLGTGE